MNKRYWIIGLLVVVAGFLLWLLLRDPKQPDSHNYQHEQAQADLKIVRQQRDSGLKVIDSLQGVIAKRDTEKGELKNRLSSTRSDLDKSVAKIVRITKEAKENERMWEAATSDYRITWIETLKLDSLKEEAVNLAYLYQQYKDFSDSLTVIVSKNEVDYKAALTEQKRLYDNLYSKYEQLYKLYEQLFKDYSSVKKSIKRERLKTKIAALLALVAGGAAVIK